MLGAFILQIVLIILNGIFAAAEIAVISAGEGRLSRLAEKGDRRAKRLVRLTADTSKFLSTIQVAITLAGLLGSAYAADNFAEPLVDLLVSAGVGMSPSVLKTVCVFLITLILSYFNIVLGELVPKRLAMRDAEGVSLALSGLLSFVSRVFAPFVAALTLSTNGILRLMGVRDSDGEEVTEEDIRSMLDAGSRQGAIRPLENQLIQNVFEFDDVAVGEICTHRREVEFLYEEDSFDSWRETITGTSFSYYPLCREDPDHVVGVINAKKFLKSGCTSREMALKLACDPPYFVPDSLRADLLFAGMQQQRRYFAVVLDEYGGTSGVITIHDLLEQLVGDMREPEDNTPEEVSRVSERSWRVLGRAPLEEVSRAIGVELESGEYDTFGGYIMGLAGSVPEDGQRLRLQQGRLLIEADEIGGRRVESALVTLLPEEQPESAGR